MPSAKRGLVPPDRQRASDIRRSVPEPPRDEGGQLGMKLVRHVRQHSGVDRLGLGGTRPRLDRGVAHVVGGDPCGNVEEASSACRPDHPPEDGGGAPTARSLEERSEQLPRRRRGR